MGRVWRHLFTADDLRDQARSAYRGHPVSVVVDVGSESARFALTRGWSRNEMGDGFTFAWAEGGDSEVVIDLTPGEKTLVFDACPYVRPGRRQEVEVALNGRSLGCVTLEDRWKEFRIPVPADAVIDGRNTIRFRFAHTVVPRDLDPAAEDERALAATFNLISIVDTGASDGVWRVPAGALDLTPRPHVLNLFLEAPSGMPTCVDARDAFAASVPGGLTARFRVRGATRLDVSHAIFVDRPDRSPAPIRPVTFQVEIRSDDGRTETYVATQDSTGNVRHRRWIDAQLSLDANVGHDVEVTFAVDPPTPERHDAFPVWSMPVVSEPSTRTRAPSRPNVMLVSLDTVRADHLGCYGYSRPTSPCIDALAASGVVFENAIAPSPHTAPSHASLFTGLTPESHGTTNGHTPVDSTLLTLPRLLRQAGYRTGAVTGGAFVGAFLDFHHGFERLVEEGPIETAGLLARDWLARSGHEPFFFFFHNYEVHPRFSRRHFAPYPAPSSRMLDYRYDPDVVNASDISRDEKRYGIDVYDGSVRHYDDHLAILVEGLRRSGRLDDTVLILFADHGEDLWDHHGFIHGHSVYEELTHVPLVIRAPCLGLSPRRVTGQVSLVDVLPSLAEMLDLPLGTEVEGESFAPLATGEAPRDREHFALSEALCWGLERKALRTNDHKYIRTFPEIRYQAGYDPVLLPLPPEELYDLRADPGETVNILAERPEVAARFREGLDALLAGRRVAVGPHDVAEDEAIHAQLAQLGYVH